jgi:competence protein ComEC
LPLLLAFLALGAARYQLALPDISDPSLIARFNDQETVYQLEGILVEPPDVRDTYTNLVIEAESIQPAGQGAPQPAHGRLLARVPNLGDEHYGDRLRLQGTLVTPPETEGFSYRDYLYRQQVFSLMEWPRLEILQHGQGNPWLVALYTFRDRLVLLVYRLYPDPEASLLAGILLGVETGIPGAVSRAFRDTGTAHIIAISGENVIIFNPSLTNNLVFENLWPDKSTDYR